MTTQTSSFSWHRVAQLYQYNAPWLIKQTAIYFLFSLTTAIIFLLTRDYTWQVGLYSTCCTVQSFMFIWSPIIFTKGGDSRIVDRLIPAKPVEKFVFYMSYLLVVMPIACYLLLFVAEKIYLYSGPADGPMNNALEIELLVPTSYKMIQYLATLAAMLTCFYFVIAAKRNRFVKAYLLSIGVLVITSSFPSFFIVKEAFLAGYNEAIGIGPKVSEAEIAGRVFESVTSNNVFLIIGICIIIAYILLIFWSSYRALYRRNI